ncbi:MAG: hypothetical protein KA319_14755 [Ferruginibacter sp.]|nr:hypothetical protein [Ferruginibacter sp.]
MKTADASNLIKYIELLAGFTGIICYRKNRKSIWFAFAVYLLVLYGMEELGTWFGKQKLRKENTILYKWIVVPSLFFMYHMLYYYIVQVKYKKFVIVSGILFLALALFENIFWNKEHFYSISMSISYGCLAVLFFSLLYFFDLVKGDNLLHFKRLMSFWVCTGLLIFYLGSFPYLTFFNSMAISKTSSIAVMYRWIFIFLNYTMYILFTIGYICSKPK